MDQSSNGNRKTVTKLVSKINVKKDVFISHYPMLYSIMIDVDDLLPWFVQKKIITLNSPVEIWVKVAVREKVESYYNMFLAH